MIFPAGANEVPATGGRGLNVPRSRSAMDIAENQDTSGNTIVAVQINPYESYKESVTFGFAQTPGVSIDEEPDYEPVEAHAQTLFDDPDYALP